MRTKYQSNNSQEYNRSIVPLLVGTFIGFGFGAAGVYSVFVSEDPLSKRETESVAEKIANLSETLPSSPDRGDMNQEKNKPLRSGKNEALKSAFLAQMSKRDLEPVDEERKDPRGPDPEEQMRAMESSILRDALPGNILVPGIRTPDEIRTRSADIDDQIYLRDLIKKRKATEDDFKEYYELQLKQHRDQLAVLDYCEKNISEASAQGKPPMMFCLNVDETNPARVREMTHTAMERLRQDYKEGFPEVHKKETPRSFVQHDER
jgi:hypothetical protein